MSASSLGWNDSRPMRFWDITIGKKAVMAVSGVVLFGFVAGHLIGNLQIYQGPQKINEYSSFLRTMPALVWGVRITLLGMVALHVTASVQLALRKREARPIDYVTRKAIASSYASRTMYWSGPILGAFVIYHLLQFTFGAGGTPFRDGDVYGNIVAGFQAPAVSAFYIVAMLLLGMHLYHGLASMFQSAGISHPRYTPLVRGLAKVVAVAIAAGNISIPLAVLTGIVS